MPVCVTVSGSVRFCHGQLGFGPSGRLGGLTRGLCLLVLGETVRVTCFSVTMMVSSCNRYEVTPPKFSTQPFFMSS